MPPTLLPGSISWAIRTAQGVGQQLVVGALENSLVIVGFLVLDQTAAVPGIETGAVDLVEGEPRNPPDFQPLIEGFCSSGGKSRSSGGFSSRHRR